MHKSGLKLDQRDKSQVESSFVGEKGDRVEFDFSSGRPVFCLVTLQDNWWWRAGLVSRAFATPTARWYVSQPLLSLPNYPHTISCTYNHAVCSSEKHSYQYLRSPNSFHYIFHLTRSFVLHKRRQHVKSRSKYRAMRLHKNFFKRFVLLYRDYCSNKLWIRLKFDGIIRVCRDGQKYELDCKKNIWFHSTTFE